VARAQCGRRLPGVQPGGGQPRRRGPRRSLWDRLLRLQRASGCARGQAGRPRAAAAPLRAFGLAHSRRAGPWRTLPCSAPFCRKARALSVPRTRPGLLSGPWRAPGAVRITASHLAALARAQARSWTCAPRWASRRPRCPRRRRRRWPPPPTPRPPRQTAAAPPQKARERNRRRRSRPGAPRTSALRMRAPSCWRASRRGCCRARRWTSGGCGPTGACAGRRPAACRCGGPCRPPAMRPWVRRRRVLWHRSGTRMTCRVGQPVHERLPAEERPPTQNEGGM